MRSRADKKAQDFNYKSWRRIGLLGPAFVAAISYVDPGNVAANISAGSQYSYLLVWVLVLASTMSVLLQYQSAKLGIVTGKSLPEILGERMKSDWLRYGFWMHAEIIAIATDVAEILGGAIAFNLLFAIPLSYATVLTSIIAMVLLILQSPRTQSRFELVVIVILAIIVLGFLFGLLIHPPQISKFIAGLIPRFADQGSVLIAVSMIGATVMPHAIYLHSGMVNDRFTRFARETNPHALIKATRVDVIIALLIAGCANIGLLVLAANSLAHNADTDTIEGAYQQVKHSLGPLVAIFFGIGLLASGIASSSVGAYAGATIMQGLIHRRIPIIYRRIMALLPALAIVNFGISPSSALIFSQVILSFGIPFAIIPLIRYCSDKTLMHEFADSLTLKLSSILSAILIIIFNVVLIYLQFIGN